MAVQAPPGVPYRAGFADPGGLPPALAGWSLIPIGAGLWASATGRSAPAEAQGLTAEPGRVALVVDARRPDQRTDALIAQLLPRLAGEGRSVRLVLAGGADRYVGMAQACRTEILAAEAGVVLTPHGYAVVRPGGPARLERPPQWRRCLPQGGQGPAGMLAPSPAWDQQLAAGLPAPPALRLAVRRVPAGLLLGDGSAGPAGLEASSVWPDLDRVTVVIGAGTGHADACGALAELLPLLPGDATDGIRLYWPRAAAGEGGSRLSELAARCGSDLIAPVADVSPSGCGGVCHGPMGAAPWLRFTSRGDVQVLGSLYPEPGWERALAAADFARLGVEQVAAGLCVSRPGPGARGLTATARSIIPAPSGPVVVAGGDAGDPGVRRDVTDVLGRLPAGGVPRLRLLLTGAGAGGSDAWAQALADEFGFVIAAPAGRWTASPDGFVRALPVTGSASPAAAGEAADPWRHFQPREDSTRLQNRSHRPGAEPAPPAFVPRPSPGGEPGSPPPAAPLAPLGGTPVVPPPPAAAPVPSRAIPVVSPSPAVPGEPPLAGALGPVSPATPPVPPVVPPPPAAAPVPVAPSAPVPPPDGAAAAPLPVTPPPSALPTVPPPMPVPAGPVVLLARDHRSTAAERLRYRESAARYQTYLVAVRRVLTQRPGLRSAAATEGEDAVVTDFAALLDFLDGDQRSLAEAIRTPGAGPDPRVVCAVSGLRRLPSFTGAVFSSASLPPAAAGGYRPGVTLAEPALVHASSAHRVLLAGNVEYVLWSQTGKRAAALAPDFGGDEIVFAAGTAYKVLKADVTGPGPARVFLRESLLPPSPDGLAAGTPGTLDEMDHRVLDRLTAAAALRDHVAAAERIPARLPGSTGQPVGLDVSGHPFR